MTFKDSAYSCQYYFYVIDAFLTCTHIHTHTHTKSETYTHKPTFIYTHKYILHTYTTHTHTIYILHTHTPHTHTIPHSGIALIYKKRSNTIAATQTDLEIMILNAVNQGKTNIT